MLNPRKTKQAILIHSEIQVTFLNNFELYINPNLTQVEIFSTGTGSADKADF
jgi:hypothetical protein